MQALQALERLRDLGFQFLTLECYERQVAAEHEGFVALLEYTPAGEIRQFSSAGYLVEGQIALLVERDAASYFVHKQHQVPATAEMMERYRRFQHDLNSALAPPS